MAPFGDLSWQLFVAVVAANVSAQPVNQLSLTRQRHSELLHAHAARIVEAVTELEHGEPPFVIFWSLYSGLSKRPVPSVPLI